MYFNAQDLRNAVFQHWKHVKHWRARAKNIIQSEEEFACLNRQFGQIIYHYINEDNPKLVITHLGFAGNTNIILELNSGLFYAKWPKPRVSDVASRKTHNLETLGSIPRPVTKCSKLSKYDITTSIIGD